MTAYGKKAKCIKCGHQEILPDKTEEKVAETTIEA
jgi:hypothetical protein